MTYTAGRIERIFDQICETSKQLSLEDLNKEYKNAKGYLKSNLPDYEVQDINYSVSQMMLRTVANGVKIMSPGKMEQYLEYLQKKIK